MNSRETTALFHKFAIEIHGLLERHQKNTEAWPTTHTPLLRPDEASMRFQASRLSLIENS
jgi:hypothetical protein